MFRKLFEALNAGDSLRIKEALVVSFVSNDLRQGLQCVIVS